MFGNTQDHVRYGAMGLIVVALRAEAFLPTRGGRRIFLRLSMEGRGRRKVRNSG